MKDGRPCWEGKKYSFLTNKDCECFPCHETRDPEGFNCLFCFCPLYALGERCGGNYRYLENGVKDCSGCTFPHERDSYGRITERFEQLAELAKQNRK